MRISDWSSDVCSSDLGIAVDSVSGITAGLAVGSALGLPLTHRAVSRGVTLVTAHTADGTQPDWKALAQSGLTIVCYMGRSEEHTSELQSLMRISYDVFCLKKQN